MNELFPTEGVIEDPAFLLLGAMSLGAVLVFLYRGAWKYLTGFLINLLTKAFALAWVVVILFAVGSYFTAFTGPPRERAVSLTWAVILTAFAVIMPSVFGLIECDDNPVGRFVAKCKPDRDSSSF